MSLYYIILYYVYYRCILIYTLQYNTIQYNTIIHYTILCDTITYNICYAIYIVNLSELLKVFQRLSVIPAPTQVAQHTRSRTMRLPAKSHPL